MGILDTVNNTPIRTGIRVVVSGVEKVGKTTLVCSAPRVMLVPLEQGYAGQNVYKTSMLESFEDVLSLLDEILAALAAGKFCFQTVAFDSATALERMIHDDVLRTDPTYGKGNRGALTMEAALGGYGKAYQYANERFATFLGKCDRVALYGVNIVLTCHVFAAKVVDPAFGEFDTWDLLLHSPKNQKAYGKREMLTQWADVVGFLHEPLFVQDAGKGKTLAKGISANKGRILAVNRTPGWVAGNRFGVVEDIALPPVAGWNNLANAIYSSRGLDYFNRDI